MAEQKVIDKAKAWADKEYDELRYSKCEKKHFVFTFRELREMGKQAFIAGHDAATEELEKENADLKRDKEDLIFIRNQNAKYMCEDKERLTKARALLEQWLQTTHAGGCDNVNLGADTEQFLAGDL